MRVIEIRRIGGPEVLEAGERALPEPGPGQARIRHEAIGLNLIDTYHRKGLYPVPLPFVPGSEAAGVVDALGPSVSGLKVGDRVAYLTSGAYADYGVGPADRMLKLPDGVSTDLAAASLLKGLTAEFLAERIVKLQAGDAALVYAAAGGVGAILTQWLARAEVRVIAVVGSQVKADAAKRLGADEVIVDSEQDIAEHVRDLTDGKGVRVVYDSVGRDTLEASLKSLGRRGMLISYGNASGPPPAVEPLQLLRGGSLLLTRPSLFDYVSTAEELAASSQALFARLQSGRIEVEIGRRFALADVSAAHQAIESRTTTGSTILIP